ncbi:MAG: hypothetical protein ACI9D5_002102 [Candidatus Endobugula sp.]|jgi:hypothetical protein
MSMEQFEHYALLICVGGLILFMTFIMWDLAKQSNAGKFGTIILFAALGIGLLGFLIKTVMLEIIDS